MLIQVHLLQNYAPANLNRDDTGAPKDAIFGGQRRGRVSSQCLKRSIRRSDALAAAFGPDGLLGVRTKNLPELIGQELQALTAAPDEVREILKRVPEIGRESTKRAPGEAASDDGEEAAAKDAAEAESETKQLIFIGRSELRPLAESLLAAYRKLGAKAWAKAKMADITRELGASVPRSVDIAMFGRMTTSSAFEDVQAAVQVAHALSTNALVQEFDYYTAVDDLSGEAGAGMIGDIEFNSSTYYRYANIQWEQLLANLGGDVEIARRAVLAFLDAAATAQPTGKQNTFAAHNLPDVVLVEISGRNLPVSYTNAFLRPVRANGQQSLMDASAAQLGDYMGRLIRAYGLQAERAFLATADYALPEAQALPSLSALCDWVAARLPEA